MAVIWVIVDCSLIGLIMEAAGISETSVNFYQTPQHNTPEDSLHPF
jgi:hypothetical protein